MSFLDKAKNKLQSLNVIKTEKLPLAEVLGMFIKPDELVRIEAYDGSSIGKENAPFKIILANQQGANYLATSTNELRLMRAYLTGGIKVEGMHPGDPYDLLKVISDQVEFPKLTPQKIAQVVKSVGIKNFKPPTPPEIEAPPRWKRNAEGLRHSLKRDAEAIHYHYDISNEFYSYVLGPSMTYTCAVYPNGNASLEEAQENKYRLVFEKLALKSGDKLLDVGCGWGGMVRYAAKRGVKAIGATLSEEQAKWAQAQIKKEGLEDLAEVRFCDYREVPEKNFDAISSIGITEHIGVKNYPDYFVSLRNKLKPGGKLLNHCITRPDNKSVAKAGPFIDRYAFPDGELTGSGRIISVIQDIGGLEVIHSENFREHYAITLRDWCANLVKNWDKAVAAANEQIAKTWGIYMAGSRLGFNSDVVELHQVLAIKQEENKSPNYPLRPWWQP